MDSPFARMSPLGTMSLSSALALSASVSVVCATIAVLRLFSILPHSGGDAPKPRLRPHHPTCKLSVFLGSGGHTSESLAMISGLDFKKYQPRVYYVSEGDTLSAHKAIELERRKIDATRESSNEVVPSYHGANSNDISRTQPTPDLEGEPYKIVVIPRARRVHQSLLTTPVTALVSLLSCIYFITVQPFLQRKSRKSRFNQRPRGTSSPPAGGADQNEVLVLNGPGTCLMLAAAVYLNRILALPSPVIIYVESFARVSSLSLSGRLIQPFADRFIVQWPQLLRSAKTGEYHGWLV
ncbi:Alg14-domain-containing protein [Coprinellus micaceus]|uniref:UDP-N-acetylglucosamine transferase subunit ALG14 n=1 Tax=Coprinellus micaceus TaxID=71717 RepID=A0A4Y7TWF1_COPMI|nr:Alg14-domain-containing protein [Coprinellus micaceus]